MNPFSPQSYWEDRLTQDMSLRGVGDIRLGHAYNQWLYRVRRSIFRRSIATLPIPFAEADVLDIGAGTGFYIERWHECGARAITGVDITQSVVDALAGRYPNLTVYRLDIGDADTAPLPPGHFAAISAFDVLYHIVDDEQYVRALRNIHRLLKPGGYFIFSDNFVHTDAVRTTHQVSRPLRQIEGLLAETGFEIVDRFPMFVLMANPVDSTSRLARWYWKALRAFIRLHEATGFLAGMALYLPELLRVRTLRESPTTEIMICRRSA